MYPEKSFPPMHTLLRKFLTFPLVLVLTALACGKNRPEARRLRQFDFSSSTQRLGLRFTERLRDLWRTRWLKLRR